MQKRVPGVAWCRHSFILSFFHHVSSQLSASPDFAPVDSTNCGLKTFKGKNFRKFHNKQNLNLPHSSNCLGCPSGSVVKNPPASAEDARDVVSIPGLGRYATGDYMSSRGLLPICGPSLSCCMVPRKIKTRLPPRSQSKALA